MYNSPATTQKGGIAKWPKATVCKTVIRGFKSHSRLSQKKQQLNSCCFFYGLQ